MPSSHSPDTIVVAFDDAHAVANAGLLLSATMAERLGIQAVVDRLVDLGDRPAAFRPGRKVLTWSTRSSPGRTASTTPRCCAQDPPPRC
jgi:hypothetical protein